MSKVISFRLDKDNPRESRALGVLLARREQGYSVRHVITNALLIWDEIDQDRFGMLEMDELKRTLSEVSLLLNRIEREGNIQTVREDDQPTNIELSEAFIASVKNAAKPGYKPD
ncbi:MAG: hypothetical protein PVG14_05880 [Anaerolineales bacterium]|jgi:hypothetical protein